ncbi:unnamed protein product [Nezara viridula]|uniref:Uncharacterized protein n=1 Tax=Nezara viridula TaxID=85310 RepID=A0A9P0H904_NEZVI|nr:unnamed protein product [Nezara viridula]
MSFQTLVLVISLSLNCILFYLYHFTCTASSANPMQCGTALALTPKRTQNDVATSTEGFTEVTGDTTSSSSLPDLTEEATPQEENYGMGIIHERYNEYCRRYNTYLKEAASNGECEDIYYNEDGLNNSIREKHLQLLFGESITIEKNEEYHSKTNVHDAAIHTALRRGSPENAKTIIADTADVDIKGLHGQAPLHLAAWRGDESLVNLLISKNVNVNVLDDCKHTPIHYAIRGGHLNIVEILLDHGADTDIEDYNNVTPLEIAVVFCHESIVDLILSKNANVYLRILNYLLNVAIKKNNINIVNSLLKNGANVNHLNMYRESPLMIATKNGNEAIVNLLLSKYVSVDVEDEFGNTALQIAISKMSINVVKSFLNNGAMYKVNKLNLYNESALMIATKEGNEAIVNLLLSMNANVDVQDRDGNTALDLAIMKKNINIAEALLNNGANVNAQGETGTTPLMAAASNGDEAMVNFLLFKKASLKIRDDFGNEAIHLAAQRGNIKVIEMLLGHGADVNSEGEHGETPLHFAVRNDDTISEDNEMFKFENKTVLVMKTLLEHGAELNSQSYLKQTALHKAAAGGYAGVVGYLLSRNASLVIEDYICFTPLQWAASIGNVKVLNTLLERDDVNRNGCNGVTALHMAIRRNDTAFIEYLLRKNADPNLMSEDGQTPLDLTFDPLSEKIMKFLLDHEARVEDNSFLGSKILFDAVSNRSIEIIKLLLDKTKNFNSYPTTILNHAIGERFSEGIDLLIAHGADVVEKDIHGNLPLTLAVMSRNIAFVKLILETGSSKIKIGNDTFSKKNFQTFLDANCDVELFTSNNSIIQIRNATAMHVASFYGLKDLVRLLISYNASLELRDRPLRHSPLHYACENDHVEVVKLILNSTSIKSPADINGTTPLHIACRKGLLPIAKLLLSDPPAAVNQADNSGYTALHLAAMNGSLEIAELLLTLNADKEAKTLDFKTPLHIAAREGHEDIVRILLREGAEKDAADINGMTPLHFAARERHSYVVRSMLGHKAYINSRNKNGSTPLHLLCEWNNKSERIRFDQTFIVGILFYHGADIHSKDNNQMTPLHIAARDNSSEAIEYLLYKRADPFRRDRLLNIPMHYAALFGHYGAIIQLLLENKYFGIKKPFRQTTSVNINKETPLFLAAREGHTKVVALLLQVGVESLQPDINGRTALHRSAARGHFEVVKLLRQALLKIENEDKWGFTALNYAASWKGHQDVIGYLSATQLNITLSYYLNISKPLQPNLDNISSIEVQKLYGIKLGIPYFFKVNSGKFRYIYLPLLPQSSSEVMTLSVIDSAARLISFNLFGN